PDEQGALVRATVASDQTAAVTNQTATMILPGMAAPRTAPPPQSAAPIRPGAGPPPAALASGSLKISASATANPISVNGVTTFVIGITNDRSVPDRDVSLSIQALDDGLSVRVSGSSPTPV